MEEGAYSLPSKLREARKAGVDVQVGNRTRRQTGRTNSAQVSSRQSTPGRLLSPGNQNRQFTIVPRPDAKNDIGTRKTQSRFRPQPSASDRSMLIDIDRDGHIDSNEFKMSHTVLSKVRGRDLNNDGTIDENEVRNTRIIEGQKQLLKDVISRNVDRLNEFNPKFEGAAPREVLDHFMDYSETYGGFPAMMAHLEQKERLFRRSSSVLMDGCLTRSVHSQDQGVAGPETGRRMHAAKLTRAIGVNKAHLNNIHNRSKGNIPEYGNFSNYAKRRAELNYAK